MPACREAMLARERRQAGAAAIAVLALTALLSLAGCSEEPSFGAQEFVDEINSEGVELRLGEELFTDQEDKQLYAVELEPLPGADLPGEEGGHGHTAGSLSVHDDSSGAAREIEKCQASADLLCYRAANVVVVLEGGGIEAQQLGIAIQRLADE